MKNHREKEGQHKTLEQTNGQVAVLEEANKTELN